MTPEWRDGSVSQTSGFITDLLGECQLWHREEQKLDMDLRKGVLITFAHKVHKSLYRHTFSECQSVFSQIEVKLPTQRCCWGENEAQLYQEAFGENLGVCMGVGEWGNVFILVCAEGLFLAL